MIMAKWFTTVRGMGKDSELVREAGVGVELEASVTDILANRATATLRTRHGALMSYLGWAQSQGIAPWPTAEAKTYKFLQHLKQKQAPATKAGSVLKALSFAAHLFGMEGGSRRIKSERVRGAAWAMFATKGVAQGRSPFTVGQLRLLQATVLADHAEEVDRLMAGLTCLLVSCRLRYFDAQRSTLEPVMDLDSSGMGYVEVAMRATKTTNTPRLKHAEKVGVGHVQGVNGENWVKPWLEVRKKAGINAAQCKCLMPAPNGKGGYFQRRLRSDELLKWMKVFFQRSGAEGPPKQKLGTHSSKVTLLTWAGKFGLPKGDRRTLGYHMKAKDVVVNLYSRDAQAAPLRRLAKVEHAVRVGTFFPDETRSGRFKEVTKSEVKDVKYILATIYDKVHLRREATDVSKCGRARIHGHSFKSFAEFPSKFAKSKCKACFKEEE